MARINLLPWRHEERLRKNKEFNLLAAATGITAALLVGLTMLYLNNQLSAQESANEMIREENARLDGVIKEIESLEAQKELMVSRMKVIQDLQGRRSVPVRVWDDIARAVPPNMYLISIKREGDTITINGFADNNNVVSKFVRNLDESAWLANSLIPQIKTKIQAYETTNNVAPNKNPNEEQRPVLPEDSYVEFTVTTQVKSDEPKEGEAATPTPTADVAPQTTVVINPPAPTQAPAPETANAAQPNAGQTAPASEDPKPVIADTTGAPPPSEAPATPSNAPATPPTNNSTSAGGQ